MGQIIGFALCLENKEAEASLELRKIYPVIEPEPNDPNDFVRLIDEDEEDYLYPREMFQLLTFDKNIEQRILQTITI